MRRVLPHLLILLVLTTLSACDSGSAVSQESSLAPSEIEALAEDAKVLAFRYQLAVEHDSDTVALPQALVQSLHQSLIRVRESERGDLAEGIRGRPDYTLSDVLLGANASVTWTDAWRRGDLVTGYAPVDDLVRRYNLTLDSYYEYPDIKRGLLRSETLVNTVALARKFEPIPDLRYASPNGIGGDGDTIEAVRLLDGWRLDFSRGSGDCPAGCIHRTYWTFRVTGAGVEYLGTRDR